MRRLWDVQRKLWGRTQTLGLPGRRQPAFLNQQQRLKGTMEADDGGKPWALFTEHCVLNDFLHVAERHFRLVEHRDFLRDPALHGPRVQALLVWGALPEALPPLLAALPALKVVSNGGVGVDHLDVPYIAGLGVRVANTPGVVSDATADMAMALLLASARSLVKGHQISMEADPGDLHKKLMGVEVTGATLGIVGMGHIGLRVARRSRGFDMKVLYHNRSRRSAEDENAVGASYLQSLDQLLAESDFVVLAVNLSPETTGLIGRRELALMKPTATLVNVSRGLVVDQDALVEALKHGTIRAAALDVTYPEPLPKGHPLLGLSNVIITPHIGTDTDRTTMRMVERMVENALAGVKGQAIPNEVKPQ